MKHIISWIVATLLTMSFTFCVTDIQNQDEHFVNVSNKNYVLVAFLSLKVNSKAENPLRKALEVLAESNLVKSHNVVVELINTEQLPFFDDHYDLAGRSALRLFICNHMTEMEGFAEQLNDLAHGSLKQESLLENIEGFIGNLIGGISTELKDIEHLRELLRSKRVIGLYAGENGFNFKRFFHVARKNTDFDFVHTFDKDLKAAIFSELSQRKASEENCFAVLRHPETLNEFDNTAIVYISDFKEKVLTEFLEFERFDKLRAPDQGREIFMRLALKAQPMVLFVHGSDKASSKFEEFKEAVKELPKKLIYSHTDVDTTQSSHYLQLFMLANQLVMAEETLYIIWMTPNKQVRITELSNDFTKNSVKDFVYEYLSQNHQLLDTMRGHLYDKEQYNEHEIAIEEL